MENKAWLATIKFKIVEVGVVAEAKCVYFWNLK